jgi:RNA polymerase sigma-70 factor (ECF subfamily)
MADPLSLDPAVLLAQQAWVERLARGLVRDSSLAQDLAQEAWLRVARGGPDDERARRGFLAGVVRNLERSHARAERRRARREELAARPEALPSPAELVERAELQHLLVENVLALDETERTAILLRYFEGLTAEEIARRSSVPAGTVRSRLSRGLESLRERLEARIERRDLLAGLCVLGREPGPSAHAPGPAVALSWIGGLLAMKTLTTIAAACAALLTVAGLWFLGRVPLPRSSPRTEEPREPAAAVAPAASDGPELALGEEPAPRIALETPRASEPEASPGAALPVRILARVTDENGRGLAGVEVRRHEEPAGASGALGRIELELACEPRSETALTEFEFRHPGFALARRQVRLAPGCEVHLGDVALVPAASIRGRVEDDSGARVGAARLITSGLENPRTDPEELRRLGPEEEEGSVVVEAGADGTFELAGVPLGPCRLWAGRADLAWSSVELQVPREGLRDVVLVVHALDATDRIGGRVLSPAGEPVPEARIHYWFMAATYGTGGSVEAGADGRFEILLPARVAHDLTISDPRDRWSEVYLFRVEPGTRELDVRFEPERWIEVSVSDPDGKPLERFELGLESAAEGNWLRMSSRTEEPIDGRTRLRVPNAAFRVTAGAAGCEHVVRGPFDPHAPPEWIELQLAALAGIRGVVRASSGLPAAGAKVGLCRAVADKTVIERDGFRLTTEEWSDEGTTTDAEGRFVLYPKPSRQGVYESQIFVLRAEAAGHARTELPPQPLDPRAGAELELTLVQGGAIEGRARTAPGVDPTGLLLAFHRGDGDIETVRLGPDGARPRKAAAASSCARTSSSRPASAPGTSRSAPAGSRARAPSAAARASASIPTIGRGASPATRSPRACASSRTRRAASCSRPCPRAAARSRATIRSPRVRSSRRGK